jgi:hypothetical protein
MDRELKAELLKRSLYVLDEGARSSVGKSVCPLSRRSTVRAILLILFSS